MHDKDNPLIIRITQYTNLLYAGVGLDNQKKTAQYLIITSSYLSTMRIIPLQYYSRSPASYYGIQIQLGQISLVLIGFGIIVLKIHGVTWIS